MSNKGLIIPERSRSIGQFTVGRLIPFRKKRNVGPFVFIDHMGPRKLSKGEFMDIDQHPHIGLCTLTYLLEGAIEHTDSTGAQQVISAGDVGLMTAGKAVTHTERTPKNLRNSNGYTIHGYQIWIGLPKEKENMQPRFDFLQKEKIPFVSKDGLNIKVIAGTGFGVSSPLPVHSDLFMLELKADSDQLFNSEHHLNGELGVLVISGSVGCGDEEVEAGKMIIHDTANDAEFLIRKGSHLLLFGGEPFPEERFLYWNFCSSSKSQLEKAKQDWKAKLFPKITNDNTYIPLPE